MGVSFFAYITFSLYYYTLVSKRIIDLHGGRIGVYSPGEGLGSTFFFEIPVVDKSPSMDPRDRERGISAVSVVSAVEGSNNLSNQESASVRSRGMVVGIASRWADGASMRSNRTVNAVNTSVRLNNSSRIFPMRNSAGNVIGEFDGACSAGPNMVGSYRRGLNNSGNRSRPTSAKSSRRIVGQREGLTGILNSSLYRPMNFDNSSGPANIDGVFDMPSPLGMSPSTKRPQVFNEMVDECRTLQAFYVLIVDDASSNRKMVRRVLGRSISAADEAEDGLAALYKVTHKMERDESLYDVILIDFMMPNMDGPTATRAIRGLGYSGIIIGITGTSSPEDVATFTLNGADAVMSKPLDVDLLTSTISRRSMINTLGIGFPLEVYFIVLFFCACIISIRRFRPDVNILNRVILW